MKRMIALTAALLIALTAVLGCCGAEEVYDDRLTVIAMLYDESDFILVVETALYEKGYLDELCVDGYFDEYTEAAVMEFQIYKGYEPDGMLTKSQFYWLSRSYYNDWFDASDIVYITQSGSRYHEWDCKSLSYSYGVMPISTNTALTLGYLPCRVCNPGLYYGN